MGLPVYPRLKQQIIANWSCWFFSICTLHCVMEITNDELCQKTAVDCHCRVTKFMLHIKNTKFFKSFKGTWQRGGFSGVFAEIGSS
jgi:hypothetical protein